MLNPQLEQALLERIKKDKPSIVLIVAPELPPSIEDFSRQTSEVSIEHVVFESVEHSIVPLGRYDFVAVVLGSMQRSQAEHLVFRLRDLHATLLWVLVSGQQIDGYAPKHAIAQGMRAVNLEYIDSDTWYEHSLEFYKPVPQWLNANNWANPQRWEKSRW